MHSELPQENLGALLDAERELQRAQLESDVEALDALIHDNLRFIGPDTQVHGKSDDLESHRNQVVKFLSSEELELDAHVFGPAAVTTALIALEVEIGGEKLAGTYRYIRGWVMEEDRWQIASGAVVAVRE